METNRTADRLFKCQNDLDVEVNRIDEVVKVLQSKSASTTGKPLSPRIRKKRRLELAAASNPATVEISEHRDDGSDLDATVVEFDMSATKPAGVDTFNAASR